MYNIVVLWFCCFVVLLFSDFVECISNAFFYKKNINVYDCGLVVM